MLLFLAAAGLVAGVLINNLADNLPPDEHGERRRPGWPHCRNCGARYSMLDWFATLALVTRRGRCRHCGRWRGWRPVLVELVTALGLPYLWTWSVSGAVAVQAGDALLAMRFLAAALIFLCFVLIAVIDIEHRLILRIVVIPTALAIAIMGSLDPARGVVKTLLGGVAGFGIMLAVYLFAGVYTRVQNAVRRRPLEDVAFGGGDVNLAAAVGFAVGWPGVLLALVIAIFAGALYGLALIVPQLMRREYDPHSAMPYGPFLIAGALTIYLYGKDFAQFWISAH